MAKILKNADAPEDLNVVLLGNVTLDFSEGEEVESDDYNTVGAAEQHPYLEVVAEEPQQEPEQADGPQPDQASTPQPEAEVTTQTESPVEASQPPRRRREGNA